MIFRMLIVGLFRFWRDVLEQVTWEIKDDAHRRQNPPQASVTIYSTKRDDET